MATAKIADIIVDTLASIGVTRIYGVPGDSLNGSRILSGPTRRLHGSICATKRLPRSLREPMLI